MQVQISDFNNSWRIRHWCRAGGSLNPAVSFGIAFAHMVNGGGWCGLFTQQHTLFGVLWSCDGSRNLEQRSILRKIWDEADFLWHNISCVLVLLPFLTSLTPAPKLSKARQKTTATTSQCAISTIPKSFSDSGAAFADSDGWMPSIEVAIPLPTALPFRLPPLPSSLQFSAAGQQPKKSFNCAR